MEVKRVLITGAAGFLGAVLTRRLLANGHEVHVVVKPGTDGWRLADVSTALRWHTIDLCDAAAVDGVVASIRPERVYHLAAHGAYPSQTDVDCILNTNILGTWNLLRALQPIDYEAFVNAGSSSEYGFKTCAMRESDLLEPNSFYAVAKSSQTLLCQYAAKCHGRPIVTLRLFSIYGPFEEPSRAIPTLIRNCFAGKDLDLTAPDTARDFVYVDDAVDAFLRVERVPALSGQIFNVGTGLLSTLQDVVALILHYTGASVRCRWGAMPPRIWDTQTWLADCGKSRQLLGWQPVTALAEGLQRTIRWMQERSDAAQVA